MTKISRSLSLELLKALTESEVKAWIQKVEHEVGQITWLPVGNVKNNSLACDLSSGPMPALIERVTNAKDAVIEEAMVYAGLTGTVPSPKSPREASEILLGVLDDMDSTPKQTLDAAASRVVVSLHDGSSPDRPTTVIRDRGIGQHPDDFHTTLLSLCQDNKTDKPWLHGRYNAGSSASYKFAAATVVISRRSKEIESSEENPRPDEVGATVVLYDKKKRPGPCVYMADSDGKILRLDLPNFECGTEIRLVDYDIPKYKAKAAERTGSIRQAFFAHFVRPSMPFCINEQRAKFKDRSGNQKVYGLYHSLNGLLSLEKSAGLETRPPICVYKQSHLITLGKMGSVTLRCFVLHDDAKKNYYVSHDQAFCFSLNGQRQYNKERSWFRDIGFNNIFQRIIVVVECDGIDYDERYNIFKSDREGIVHTACSDEIMERVEDILKNDPELILLEEQAKEEKIKNSAGRVSERVIDEIKRIIGGDGRARIVLGKRNPPSGARRSTDDSHLPSLPTKLNIEKKPFNASRGSRLNLYVNLDCKNGDISLPDREIKLVIAKNVAEVVGTSGILGGSVRFDIKMKADAPLGEHQIVAVFTDHKNGILLGDSSTMVVAEPRAREEEETKKGGNGPAERKVEVHWMRRDSWENMGWDGDSVGECQEETDGTITFFLNRDNRHLENAADNGDFTEESWERFLERYSLPVTTGLYHIVKDEIPADPRRVENEKRRIAQATLVSIKPELVQPETRKSVRKIAESVGGPPLRPTPAPETVTARPEAPSVRHPSGLQRHGTFLAEMQALADHHSRRN